MHGMAVPGDTRIGDERGAPLPALVAAALRVCRPMSVSARWRNAEQIEEVCLLEARFLLRLRASAPEDCIGIGPPSFPDVNFADRVG
jgi:hypothetical protein